METARLRFEAPPLMEGTPKEWQQELEDELNDEADARKIIFYVDPDGAAGKSWFVSYWLSAHRGECQKFGVSKRDDIAHGVKIQTKYFFFDVPRGTMEHLQYSALEMIKDRLVWSPKYASVCKELQHRPHIVVMCNEQPDTSKLSNDRFDIRYLGPDGLVDI